MEVAQRFEGREFIGKKIISRMGRYIGVVKDILFDPKTGEILYIVVDKPSSYAMSLNLEKTEKGELLIPFIAVCAVGDFVVISEQDVV